MKKEFKKCDYCQEEYPEDKVGNHPVNYGEEYCDDCSSELDKIDRRDLALQGYSLKENTKNNKKHYIIVCG